MSDFQVYNLLAMAAVVSLFFIGLVTLTHYQAKWDQEEKRNGGSGRS